MSKASKLSTWSCIKFAEKKTEKMYHIKVEAFLV